METTCHGSACQSIARRPRQRDPSQSLFPSRSLGHEPNVERPCIRTVTGRPAGDRGGQQAALQRSPGRPRAGRDDRSGGIGLGDSDCPLCLLVTTAKHVWSDDFVHHRTYGGGDTGCLKRQRVHVGRQRPERSQDGNSAAGTAGGMMGIPHCRSCFIGDTKVVIAAFSGAHGLVPPTIPLAIESVRRRMANMGTDLFRRSWRRPWTVEQKPRVLERIGHRSQPNSWRSRQPSICIVQAGGRRGPITMWLSLLQLRFLHLNCIGCT